MMATLYELTKIKAECSQSTIDETIRLHIAIVIEERIEAQLRTRINEAGAIVYKTYGLD